MHHKKRLALVLVCLSRLSPAIPRTTDAALRSLYMESLQKNNPVSYFLDLLEDSEAQEAARDISLKLQEVDEHWEVAA